MGIISTFSPRITPKTYLLFLSEDRIIVSMHGLNILGNPKPGKFREYPLDVSRPLSAQLQQIARDFRPRKEDSCYLGLSLSYFSIVNFSLPGAARDNLDQAVQYALMRHIPHDLTDVYTSFHWEASGEQLLISAVVCLKQYIQDLLEPVASAGITLFGIFPSLALLAYLQDADGTFIACSPEETQVLTWNDGAVAFHAFEKTHHQEEVRQFLNQTRIMLDNAPHKDPGRFYLWDGSRHSGDATEVLAPSTRDIQTLTPFPLGAGVKKFKSFPLIISLVPETVLRRRKSALRVQVAALIFLLLALAAYPLVQVLGQNSRLNTLEDRIAEVKIQAEQLQTLRTENDAIQSFIEEVSAFINDQPRILEITKELTEILTEKTWLQRLTFSKGWIQIHGTTDSATSVIEALEKSPLFSQASFDSPVSKQGGQEIFKIVAKADI